jgi:hypothetical protein
VVSGSIRQLNEELRGAVGKDYYKNPTGGPALSAWPTKDTGYRLVRVLMLHWVITLQEAALLRAELFPNPAYREVLRRELQSIFANHTALSSKVPCDTLQPYMEWFTEWAEGKPKPPPISNAGDLQAYAEHELFRVGSQAAIQRFLPDEPAGVPSNQRKLSFPAGISPVESTWVACYDWCRA